MKQREINRAVRVSRVPLELRAYDAADRRWADPPGFVPPAGQDAPDWPRVRHFARWDDARHAWAAANGFDLSAPLGSGRPTWWDFLKECAGGG